MSQSHAIYVFSVILKPSSNTYIKRLWNYFHQISSQVVKRATIKAVGLYIVLSLLSEGLQHNKLPGILWQKAQKWLNYKGYNGMRAAHFPATMAHIKPTRSTMIQIPIECVKCKMQVIPTTRLKCFRIHTDTILKFFLVLVTLFYFPKEIIFCFG